MQISNLPKLLPVPFANSGSKQDIPVASQIGVSGGRASYTDGFPPLTRTPIAAGGIPPFGTDFNGVLNDITSAIRWAQAGGGYGYDPAFSSVVSGYPIGARLANSTGDGYWINTVDGNTNNPESASATPLTGWVPVESYGVTSVTGLGGSSVTLTTLQAAKNRIVLTGSLTGNINLIVPAWKKYWKVVNNCTGNYSITIKTSAGSGVSIPSGYVMDVYGDGVNIINDYPSGSLVNIQRFTSSVTYTPSPGTKFVVIEAVGGGGGGGAAQGRTTAANQTAAAAAGGGGGAYAKVRLDMNGVSSLSVTIGAGGSGGAASSTVGNAGDPGGETSVSNGATKLITCPGGSGGNGAIQLPFNSLQQQTNRGSEIASSNTPAEALIVMPGSQGESGWTSGSGSARGGAGGSAPFGMGGSAITSQSQGTDFLPGVGRGGGGGGGISPYISGAQTPSGIGGLGSGGCVIFWEYA